MFSKVLMSHVSPGLALAPTLEALATGGATGREEDTSWGAPFLGKLGKLSPSEFFWDGLKKA